MLFLCWFYTLSHDLFVCQNTILLGETGHEGERNGGGDVGAVQEQRRAARRTNTHAGAAPATRK